MEVFEMESCVVIFFSEEKDPYGIPKEFNSYHIWGVDWKYNPGSGIAIIQPLTDGPMPITNTFLAVGGGKAAAISKARQVLRELDGNKTLREQSSCP